MTEGGGGGLEDAYTIGCQYYFVYSKKKKNKTPKKKQKLNGIQTLEIELGPFA